MPPIYGVLRGEIAVPTKTGAAAVAGAILTLTDAAHRIAVWTPHWQCRFTMISRTGWQILLPGPALTLRAMLLVQARLAGSPDRLTCRMVIGLGGMDRFGDTSLTDAAGPALTAAEQALAHLDKSSWIAWADPVLWPEQNALPQAILTLADQIARNWSMQQAEAMALALPPDNPTLQTLSKRLGISKQAVSYRLTGAGLRAIRAALDGWETHFRASNPPKPDI